MNETMQQSAEDFAGRIFESVLGAFDTWTIYVGDKFGLYDILAKGRATLPELSAASGMHERYLTEWLEHQVTGGLLTADDPGKDARTRVYSLPPGHAS